MSDDVIAKLGRFGVIDVGSNSVRFVVFDGQARSPAYFFNEKVLCGLGRDIRATGKLHPEGRVRARKALQRFHALSEEMNVQSLKIVATAAVRDATDGPDFQAEVLADTGLDMRVITGQEEARLSAQGILLGWPKANGLVCDIGGASMELAHISHGKITFTETSPLGPMQFADHDKTEAELDAEIDKRLDTLLTQFDRVQDQLFLVGGSWRAIAKLDMALSHYPLRILDAYSPDLDVFDTTLEQIIELPIEEKVALTGTSPARLSLVPMAARVLRRLLRKLTLNRVLVSAYGLREGLLYEGMPMGVREEDPLLIAAQSREQSSARFSDFGEHLADWVMPLFPDITSAHKRLVTAACHLHDVSWRSHPDYRSELSFDNATRTDLGGLLHSERMILAMALQRRYKTWEKTDQFVALKNLLSQEDIQFSQTLGIAMRLGALMAGPSSNLLGQLRITPDTVEWVLGGKSRVLFGEVTQRRFNALADTLNKKPVVIFA